VQEHPKSRHELVEKGPEDRPRVVQGQGLSLGIRDLLGVIIAAAFVAYDRYRESDVERFQQDMAQLNHRLERENSASQQTLERVKLLGELIPLLQDPKAEPLTGAYVLRSAVRIGSIDADAAVELASDRFVTELTQDQFAEVMSVVVPDGIPAIARQGVRLSETWHKEEKYAFFPNYPFQNPSAGAQNTLVAGRAWGRVLHDAVPKLEGARYQPLEDTRGVATNLYGLFVLMSPATSFQAVDLSRKSCRAIRLIGNLRRVLDSGPGDPQVAAQLSHELTLHHDNLDNVQLARVLIFILREYGPPSGPIAEPLAQVLTEQNLANDQSLEAGELHRARESLRSEAGDLLARKMWDIQSAEPVLIDFVSRFLADVAKISVKDHKAIESLGPRWEFLYPAVQCFGKLHTEKAKQALGELARIDKDILREFPYLKEEIEQAQQAGLSKQR